MLLNKNKIKIIKNLIPQELKWIYSHTDYLMRRLYISLIYYNINKEEIEHFLNKKRIFFILSIGRSGTNFLATLLNRAPNVYVVHEPFVETIPHQKAFRDITNSYDYINNFRKKEIFVRLRKHPVDVYGEVNSYLRRHCLALKKAFPNALLFHLVRDGRDVIRSMYSRETMTKSAYDSRLIEPPEDDPYRNKWNNMSRFEKLCWYWMVENKFLRRCVGTDNIIQFEMILTDYEYFAKKLLEPIGINIPKKVWESEVRKPRNISFKYRLPHWKKWNKKMIETFKNICGEEMEKLGYKI